MCEYNRTKHIGNQGEARVNEKTDQILSQLQLLMELFSKLSIFILLKPASFSSTLLALLLLFTALILTTFTPQTPILNLLNVNTMKPLHLSLVIGDLTLQLLLLIPCTGYLYTNCLCVCMFVYVCVCVIIIQYNSTLSLFHPRFFFSFSTT